MKVVYNACFGGFSLSDAAMHRYAELKGFQVYPEPWIFGTHFWLSPPTGDEEADARRKMLVAYDIPRDDETLVQIVEEMGDAASGRCADLQIEDVPSGTLWRIDEYDGNERVMAQDAYEWKIAR